MREDPKTTALLAHLEVCARRKGYYWPPTPIESLRMQREVRRCEEAIVAALRIPAKCLEAPQ